PRQGAQLLGRDRNREKGNEIDQLAPGDPVARFAALDQRLDALIAGRGRISFQVLERKRVDVAQLELAAQRLLAGKAGGLEQIIDLRRIVLRIEIERIARLIRWRAPLESERQMDCLLAGAR